MLGLTSDLKCSEKYCNRSLKTFLDILEKVRSYITTLFLVKAVHFLK